MLEGDLLAEVVTTPTEVWIGLTRPDETTTTIAGMAWTNGDASTYSKF